MIMKKRTLFFALAATVLLCNSCLGVENPEPREVAVISGIYLLNNGSWGGNNSNIAAYDYNSKSINDNLFYKANGKNLGDLGQDMIVYGSKIYTAVGGSGVVFVTDLNGKILSEVRAGGEGNWQPRALTALKGNVFISYYEGYVGRIDTVGFNLTLSGNVGPNPEGIAAANDKVYLAVSNGLNYPDFDSTVVVIDPSSLAVKSRLTAGINPGKLAACGNNVFCLCQGNYSDIPAKISIIYDDGNGNDLVTECTYPMTPIQNGIASDGIRYVFIACSSGKNCRIVALDNFSGLVHDESFVKDGTQFSNSVCSLDIDPLNHVLFVGTSDYVNNGDMYVFTQDGCLFDKFDTGGINPIRVAFSSEIITIR